MQFQVLFIHGFIFQKGIYLDEKIKLKINY